MGILFLVMLYVRGQFQRNCQSSRSCLRSIGSSIQIGQNKEKLGTQEIGFSHDPVFFQFIPFIIRRNFIQLIQNHIGIIDACIQIVPRCIICKSLATISFFGHILLPGIITIGHCMQVIIFISSCPGTVPGSLFTPHATNIVIHNIEPRTTLPVNQSCCRRITRNIHTSQQHFVKIRHCFCSHHILRILRQKIAASAKKKYYDHIYIFHILSILK